MGFWTNLLAGTGTAGIVPNANGPLDYDPGDPDGLEIQSADVEHRSMPFPAATPWSGYPGGWDVPAWQVTAGVNKLVDIAWACLDLNSNIVSAMPPYRLKNGQIIEPKQWMTNPDPDIYACWPEFAKQLFWDYQMGEAFVLPFGTDGSDGKPSKFRVMPPWTVTVDMKKGLRTYKIGSLDVTDEILHIRYQSNVTDPHGHGPLEIAGARQTHINLLQRYATTLAETGGVPLYWLGIERRITPSESRDLLETWIESRTANPGHPAILGSKATLNQAKTMDAKDMALLELSQFSESRIAILLGVPPFLVGLAGAAGSLTYSNIADLFDFHDRSSLRPKSKMIMDSLSGWALVRGQSCELNRDDYTRLPLDKRAQIYKTLGPVESGGIGVLSIDEIRIMERFFGSSAGVAAQALTGGSD